MSSGESACLTVEFAGEVHEVEPAGRLTFGRGDANTINIDSNPRLHRSFGEISHRDGAWWLRNNGRSLPITIADKASRSSVTLAPGREISLSFPECSVSFKAGATTYELGLAFDEESDVADLPLDDVTTSALTIDQARVPLVGDQLLLAAALAEPSLRNPHGPIELPANKAIAHRFGWSTTTFNRKLDRMCKKFARQGVSGLVGSPGQLATDRRRKLVEYLIGSGTITNEHLDLLDDHGTSSP